MAPDEPAGRNGAARPDPSGTARTAPGRRPAAGPRLPTSRDVAERAGVSRTVVSFVLNDRPHTGIPEATRQRVLLAAAELGYQPNSAARSLVSGRAGTLGVIVTETRADAYDDAFLPQLLRGIDSGARAAGFRILLEYLGESPTGNPYLTLFRQGRVDGLILCGPRADDQALAELVATGVPVVVIGDPGTPACASVDVDNTAAARQAVAHLVDHGYRRIGLITNAPLAFMSSRARRLGYQQALEDAGLPVDEAAVVEGAFDEGSGQQAMRRLLDQAPHLDAVFAAADQVAFGALAGLHAAGRRVPEDVALIGFDDLPMASILRPALSTIRVPARVLGHSAGQRVIDLVTGQALDELRLLLPTTLVLRQSCGAHPEKGES
jgi:LacI family transcriptional regulator